MAEQEKPKEEKTRRDNFWESMWKTFHTAATGAQRYTRLVQKKIDLATTQRKIPAVHGELGKLIDDLHAQGETRFLENTESSNFWENGPLRQTVATTKRNGKVKKKERQPGRRLHPLE